MDNMSRLEQIAARLPEATRVDVEEWDGHPTFAAPTASSHRRC